MRASQSLLVVVEPRILELCTSYVLEPRRREVAALNLAEVTSDGTLPVARAVERAAGIAARLDGVIRARYQAESTGHAQDCHDFQSALFREIAWLGSMASTSFHQGNGCSLGLLAHPRERTPIVMPGELRHLVRAVRYLLTSTTSLTPRLALPSWETLQPVWGGPGLASGCIPLDYMTWMGGLLAGTHWPIQALAEHFFGKRTAAEWRATVQAAVSEASRKRAHLLEVDAGLLRASRSTPPPAPEVPLRSDVRSLVPERDSVSAA
jgi:hypothetical protein